MAFDIIKLTQIGMHFNPVLPQLWSYTTTDATATIDSANYFDAAVRLLKKGDLIYVNSSTGGTFATGLYWVSSNDGTHVDVNDVLVINATDTD